MVVKIFVFILEGEQYTLRQTYPRSNIKAVKWQYWDNKVLSLKCCAVLCYQRFVSWPSKEAAVFNSAFIFFWGCHFCHLLDVSSGGEGAACTKTFKEALLHNLLEVKANILEIGSSFIVRWQILEDFINTLCFWSIFTTGLKVAECGKSHLRLNENY